MRAANRRVCGSDSRDSADRPRGKRRNCRLEERRRQGCTRISRREAGSRRGLVSRKPFSTHSGRCVSHYPSRNCLACSAWNEKRIREHMGGDIGLRNRVRMWDRFVFFQFIPFICPGSRRSTNVAKIMLLQLDALFFALRHVFAIIFYCRFIATQSIITLIIPCAEP